MTTTWARCLKSSYSGIFFVVCSLIGPDSPSKEAARPVCTTQGKNYERAVIFPDMRCLLFSVVVPPSRIHSWAWRLGLTIFDACVRETIGSDAAWYGPNRSMRGERCRRLMRLGDGIGSDWRLKLACQHKSSEPSVRGSHSWQLMCATSFNGDKAV